MSTTIKPSPGTILVSEPFLKDFYFTRSVILLAEHNEDGTFGLILNKPTNLKLSETLNNGSFTISEDFDNIIFIGGPVKTDSIYFIHTRNDLIENSVKVLEGIYWGGDIDIVKQLIQQRILTKDDIRFYIGYSGWDPKQLEEELKEHTWIVNQTDANFLLKNPPESLWKKAVKNLGKDYSEWANYPIDPQLN
jgi:putative transcriptional regulator